MKNANKQENKQENNEKKFIHISFGNKRIYNERQIEYDGVTHDVVSIKLPSSSKYKGYHLNIDKFRIHSNEDGKTSYITFGDKDRNGETRKITISKYDKDTKTNDKVVLSVDELKAEFNSWRNKDKDEEKNEDSVEVEEESSKDEMDDIEP